ncbi:MAG: glycerol-3-phosphate dehydrogenase subunit GlpB [Desulfobacterales bacterium]|nr:glycerol-3-phosphate dehydrogenase subunit GlpB [Desulfobacterales bacterium]MBF0397698.1 glycerol-3-phosphate dehydrogenase subunit GlpB [Desulfobacterales bacterium]
MSRIELKCDLLVIGSGIAGMAASLFAANRGIKTIQIGKTNTLSFTSGLMDVLAVHPIEEKRLWKNPWDAIDTLKKDISGHPYSKVSKDTIEKAFKELVAFLKSADVPYANYQNKNVNIITPIGTLKPTFFVPESMLNGVSALEEKKPCLIIDFYNLKGFSALQIKETLKDKWQNLRTAQIKFLDSSKEQFAEQMAYDLEKPKNLDKLAKEISPHIKDAEILGIPAILGVKRHSSVLSKLQELLGVKVFEIPTIIPSVPGIRLKKAFEDKLQDIGVQSFYSQEVIQVFHKDDFVFDVTGAASMFKIRTKGVILSTGRFFGGGLSADREKITETIFNLEIYGPFLRKVWHELDFFAPRGHNINNCGIETDEYFHPIDKSGKVIFNNLYAVGSILAHNDWTRMKCGTGVSVATAYSAVNAFLNQKG